MENIYKQYNILYLEKSFSFLIPSIFTSTNIHGIVYFQKLIISTQHTGLIIEYI